MTQVTSTPNPKIDNAHVYFLQSELEDLCFAVLQPARFRQLRHDLDVLWGTGAKAAKSRRHGSSRARSNSSSFSTEDSSSSGSDADTNIAGSSHQPSGSNRGSSSSSGAAAGSAGVLSHSQREGMLAAPRRLLGRAVTRERSKWVRCWC